MPRKSATDKKVEDKAEVQTKVKEIPNETSENESADSALEITENPTNDVKKKRFDYKWIWIGLALISIVLFIIYFGNIKDFFLADESRIYVIGGVIIALIVGSLVWYIPKRQVKKLAIQSSGEKLTDFEREKERLKLEDDTRKTLAQLVGGVFLIAGLFVTYNTYRLGTDTYRLGLEQQKINTRGQITDRFNKAVTNLGNTDLSVRLGGLYALEQILKDSPEEHQTIIEVLSAYIREKARIEMDYQSLSRRVNRQSNITIPISEDNAPIPTDVQTALTILGRRPIGAERMESRINLAQVDLRGADLSDANLSNTYLNDANLSGADFGGADLSGAHLFNARIVFATFNKANLINANFRDSNLNQSNFGGANLSGANFLRANLSDGRFVGTNLSEVNFHEADLRSAELYEANFQGAKLMGVKSLTVKQLEKTKFDYIFVGTENVGKRVRRESAIQFFRERETENNK